MMKTEAEVRAAVADFRYLVKELVEQFGQGSGVETAVAAMVLEWVLGSEDPHVTGMVRDARAAVERLRAADATTDANKEKHRLQ